MLCLALLALTVAACGPFLGRNLCQRVKARCENAAQGHGEELSIV